MRLHFLILLLALAGPAAAKEVRFATFNASMSRDAPGDLAAALASGTDPQIRDAAHIIAQVAPDVLLINEFDYAPGRARIFAETYLGGAYPYVFAAPSNTGIASGVDLNGDGEIGTDGFAYANDAFGFGLFAGQYGMVLLSKYPLGEARTYQTLLWRDMPEARAPRTPGGSAFYSDTAWAAFRLSSKSHWAVPVQIDGRTIWALAAHPTPPVFDGPEDRNGARNADEIRLLADIAAGADYLYDDRGARGGLPAGASFVILGDLNADPFDGDSLPGAMSPLLASGLVNTDVTPAGEGGPALAKDPVNAAHRGDPAFDTADFPETNGPGNLRVDYALPSADLSIAQAGVHWPLDDPSVAASDHRLVWVDVILD